MDCGLLHGNDTVVADLVDGAGDQLADLLIAGGHGSNLGDGSRAGDGVAWAANSSTVFSARRRYRG